MYASQKRVKHLIYPSFEHSQANTYQFAFEDMPGTPDMPRLMVQQLFH